MNEDQQTTSQTPQSEEDCLASRAPRRRWWPWGFFLFVLFSGAVAAHLVGLRAINDLDHQTLALASQREQWQAKQDQRVEVQTSWKKLETEQAAQIEAKQTRIAELNAEVQSAQAERDRIAGSLTQRKKELDLVQKARDEAVTDQQKAFAYVQHLQETRDAIQLDIDSLQTKRTELAGENEKLRIAQSGLHDSLSTTETSLTKRVEELETARAQLTSVNSDRQDRSKDLTELEEDLRTTQRELTNAEAAQNAAEANAKQASQRTEKLQAQIVSLQNQKLSLEITRADLQARIEQVGAEHGQLSTKMADLKPRVAAAVDKLSQAQNAVAAKNGELGALQTQEQALRNSIRELSGQQDQLKAAVGNARDHLEKLDGEAASVKETLESQRDRVETLKAQEARHLRTIRAISSRAIDADREQIAGSEPATAGEVPNGVAENNHSQ